MRKTILEFFRKGLISCGIGPLVLVVLYLILQKEADLQTLTVREVCVGILSLSGLAFIAGGMNVIYQIEKLPLMIAIFLHGLVFTGIFLLGYLAIWAAIYSVTKRSTEKVNDMLKRKQQSGK